MADDLIFDWNYIVSFIFEGFDIDRIFFALETESLLLFNKIQFTKGLTLNKKAKLNFNVPTPSLIN